ncbi:5'-nucleotidase [Halioxenophilus sp. WMMB6]|uniref:5'-nucleotidase n=1 Tax=Halioxenophilus sp. WMMB6 TaxID=3073815 RepID=UPI00295E769C|nr:5'-nucleotidase [Halioxenophilus sp. WMMB6]
MNDIQSNKLVIAVSSSALFNLASEHEIYLTQGIEAYTEYQIAHENDPLQPGDGFELVAKLLKINDLSSSHGRVEVVLLSRNTADTGLRVFNSIEHWGLPITRAAFCGGNSPYRYIKAFGCHLFLSTRDDDVRMALEAGVAAATILPGSSKKSGDSLLRVAFDGDAVVFSDESERVYKESGLQGFSDNEVAQANLPLKQGPFSEFLLALHKLQGEFPNDCPIRTALVTARSAPAHKRVINTLRLWGVRLDECLFLGGMSKAQFLKAYGADIFFDDQMSHCDLAKEHVATGHVPHGIANH